MKEYEFRKVKGTCRLCEKCPQGEAFVIPFYYSGKSAPIILCTSCIEHLHTEAKS